MPTIVLGRDQTLSIDGTIAEGTRELEATISTKTHDASGPWNEWSSTLVVSADASIRITIYGYEVYETVMAKFNKHPPQSLSLSVSGFGNGPFVVTDVQARQPINGVCSWDVTLKLWTYA